MFKLGKIKLSFSPTRRKFKFALLILLLILIPAVLIFSHYSADTINGKNYFTKRYVLWRGWVSRDINRQQLLTVMQQAKDAGYTGIVVNDYDAVFKWGNDSGTPTQIANRKIITDKAAELGLVLIPTHNIMNGMYEGTTTSLAEALPVQNTEFNVQGGVATTQMNPVISLLNPGFESWSGTDVNQPLNYAVDAPGTVAFRESSLDYVYSGLSSIRFEDTKNDPNNNGHGRVMEDDSSLITVPQYRTYEASVWLMTENLNQPSSMNFSVYGYDADGTNSRVLYSNSSAIMGVGTAVGPNQDWTQYKLVFDSLDKTKIRIYFGSWPSDISNATGKFWFDDLAIKEVGLDNIVRRDSLPLTVKSDDGATTYIEGQDYVVGNQQLTIPQGSSIQENQNLKVSWYRYANMTSNTPLENVCHQEYWDKLNTDIGHLNSLYLDAAGYFIGYDEWRTANWDPACSVINGGQTMTGGEYLAYAMQQTENIYKAIKSSADLYVWNDMFDPYHNAVPIYYDVNGNVENSWLGLSANTIVMNWNTQQDIDARTNETKEKSSLKFFANLGNHQVLSMSSLAAAQSYLQTLGQIETESGGISGVDGFMYTSWADNGDGTVGDYSNLAAMANIIKAAGRWGTPEQAAAAASTTGTSATSVISPSSTSTTGNSKSKTKTGAVNIGINPTQSGANADTSMANTNVDSTSTPVGQGKSGKNVWVLIIAEFIVLVGVGLPYYFFWRKKPSKL